MSHFLAEPVVKKDSHDVSFLNMHIGKSSMQGWRESMEDVDIIATPIDASMPDACCVAVFDGHGGATISSAASALVKEKLVASPEFRQHGNSPESLAVALCEAFIAADEELKISPQFASTSDEIGSTGLFAIITKTHVIVANVGDSRCFLSNTKDAMQLSVDHKPDLEFEKQRIIASGGTVFRGRVCGGVAVSRSFGDFWFKRNAALKPHQQLVTAEPCIHIHQRQEIDEFLLLACDGIYDVMSNHQVRSFIRSKLKNGVTTPSQICEALVDECLAKGSRDNMSIVLVLFEGANKRR
ncbi:TPA: hypothetical protein N0F65_000621 [Lagenidium giganteum]|uniref:PPM-type phosphatase domain-containing protein n=1 Tax=Lagenidium giganteum TaxID=4803 RepID=A0AAV2YNQ1_9STRA|nr:TPA: hypothetical protein N0F65_000621 [Lagenidium giganteum]